MRSAAPRRPPAGRRDGRCRRRQPRTPSRSSPGRRRRRRQRDISDQSLGPLRSGAQPQEITTVRRAARRLSRTSRASGDARGHPGPPRMFGVAQNRSESLGPARSADLSKAPEPPRSSSRRLPTAAARPALRVACNRHPVSQQRSVRSGWRPREGVACAPMGNSETEADAAMTPPKGGAAAGRLRQYQLVTFMGRHKVEGWHCVHDPMAPTEDARHATLSGTNDGTDEKTHARSS